MRATMHVLIVASVYVLVDIISNINFFPSHRRYAQNFKLAPLTSARLLDTPEVTKKNKKTNKPKNYPFDRWWGINIFVSLMCQCLTDTT